MAEFILGSQESDLFPEEVKQCINDPDMQDVINSVQTQDLFVPVEDQQHYILQAPTPSPTCTMLCTEDYPGPYEFEVQVSGESSGKNWQFSYALNKLFITMITPIHLSFKCNSYPSGMYVRAIPVFCESKDFQFPVERCLHHRIPTYKHNEGLDANICDHVIATEHPQALYEFDKVSGRTSVRVLLDSPQAGSDSVNIAFKFMCKNSCISGMNRRATDVIFTLENSDSVVFGRQKMKVRICSCPKRDKTKEEQDLKPQVPHGKRLMHQNNSVSPIIKQRKQDHESELKISVSSMEQYLAVLDYANYSLRKTLRIEERDPTEEELRLLKEYDQELKTFEKHARKKNGEHPM